MLQCPVDRQPMKFVKCLINICNNLLRRYIYG